MEFIILFFVAPAVTAVLFGICLFRFLRARRLNKKQPGSFSKGEMTLRLFLLIFSAVVFGVFALMLLGTIALMGLAVAYM